MAEKPSRGRGAMLKEMLEKHKATQAAASAGVVLDEPLPPKVRGRAAFLQKLQEKRTGGKVGVPEAGDAPFPCPVESVTEAIKELAVEPEHISYKGTSGTPLNATANFIRLEILEDRGVFEYEVRFTPNVDAKNNRIRMVNEQLGPLSTTKVYDGDFCLYLPVQMYTGRNEFDTAIPNTGDPVKMVFTFKKKKKLSECLHLYNVLFKRIMHVLLYTRIGRNYFDPQHKHGIPQHKLEVYPGYAIAVDEMDGGLMVCLDTQHRVVRTQTVLEYFYDLRASSPPQFKELAMKAMVGTCVMTRYNNMTYVVHDIAWDMSPQDTFPTQDGSACSFVEYYERQYQISIGDLKQPLLIHRRSKTIGGNKVETLICLIPELCFLTGLSDDMRSDFKVMKDVAAYTRITPNQRMLALRTYLNNVASSPKSQEVLGGWGLKINGGTIDVQARALPSETVFFGAGGKQVNAVDWNRAINNSQITGPIDLINWVVFYTRKDERHAKNFVQTMTRMGSSMGCIIQEPKVVCLNDDRAETYKNACQTHLTSNVQAAVFICPSIRADRHTIIKKMCCIHIPLCSQVVLANTLKNEKRIRSIIFNIALQITCKLGGTLWKVMLPFRGWMVCGIDVYHAQGQKSVSGFVASMNDDLTKYFSRALFQDGEIGNSFKLPFRDALVEYHKRNGSFPSKVVIFRDGVGNGMLDHCKLYELAQLQDVLNEMKINCTITFVVVQKRINTRVFALSPDGRSAENPPSGTVVDSVVTRKKFNDFYLIPQSVRQGTVNPSHYIVIHDSAQIKPDHIQRLAYKMCFLYYNWCGPIRVPAPCQYAHKLASMAGQFVKQDASEKLHGKLWYL